MTNAEIAAVFNHIAEILSLKGENPFRIRAYARAAMMIAALTQDLKDIYAKGGTDALQEIPGIGQDLSAKIEEIVTTGKLTYIAELENGIPKGLLELTLIPGMGPKKTKFLWEKFKVESVEDLQKLLATGKLEKVKGWGEKSVENIRKGIAIRASAGTRVALPEALAIAEQIVAGLQETKLCQRIEIAGSLRRRKESIGDIDILTTSKKPEKVMDAFCGFPWVQEIIGRGETKASVRLNSGMQSDLRVVDPKLFGAALHYFTGSKEHNIHVRSLAIQRGLTLNEYGMHQGTPEKKGKVLASNTEEEIFQAVGLPWIPPELREDRGEIQAATNNTLPILIEETDLQGDLHMHTHFSDGAQSMIDMAKAAEARGLSYIAITDHASSMGMVKGIKEQNIKVYLEHIEEARKAVPGVHILAGAEVDIEEDGSLYLSDASLKHLDWVVASIHGKFQMSRAEMTKRLIRAIEHSSVRVIAHPTARLLLKRPGIEFDLDAVFAAAEKYGVALELNCSLDRLDLNDVLCKGAKEAGIKICINSDAHHAREFNYRFGIMQARRGWLTKADVINTMSWKDFEKWLRKGKTV